MIKKLTVSQIKKKLDTEFSIFIRLKYADKNGLVACYTCGIKKHWKEMQCGHYDSRSHLSTRWDEENARVQCVGCNVFKHGNMVEYSFLLEAEKKGITAKLRRKGRQIKKWGYTELQDLLTYYKARNILMKNRISE